MQLQKARKLLAYKYTWPKKNSIIQNPPTNSINSESRLLMDYSFEKLIGCMFLKNF